MRIFGLISDRQGPAHYRIALPAVALANRGHQVAVDSVFPAWVLDGEADVVVGQRIANPGASRQWQQLAKDSRSRLVYEIDDDLWHLERDNPAFRVFDGEHARKTSPYLDDGVQRRMAENIAVADAVTVSTEPLAELVAQWNDNVHILPNMVSSKLLERPMPDQHAPRLTIGWAGSPTHDRDFGEVARPLKRVLQRFGDEIEFHCMGTDYDTRVSSKRGRTRRTEWVYGVDDYLTHVDFHLGIAPLRPNTFNSAKSDLKLLEYSALGIPSIVSHTGPYARAIAAGAPARYAVDHKSWERELVALIQSPADRERLGKEAREWAATRTVDANIGRWEAAYAD